MDYEDRPSWSDEYVPPNCNICADFQVRFFCLDSEKDCITAEEWKQLLTDLDHYLENEVFSAFFKKREILI